MSNPLLDLFIRVASLEKRLAGMVRHGPVEEVNAKERWVRLNLGEGDDGKFVSAKVPYAQIAGDLKVHSAPSKGQNMTMVAPGGDARQAVALPMTWSDKNAAPNDKADEHTLTLGSVRIDLKGDEIKFAIGGFSLTITESAAVFNVGGVEHRISGGGVETTGGTVRHDSKNIGSDHEHTDVLKGGDLTGPPA
jgi:hypothetical protein